MKIEVFFTPDQVDEIQLRDKNVVVIDVLRSSTTITTALKNGAREVIPVSSVESAVKISGNLFGDVVIRGGERNGKIIAGFNLGNSPKEYMDEAVKGKSIIYCTTNGSGAMVKAKYAKRMAVAGFVNLSAVVDFIKDGHEDFYIICAGKQHLFCIEDAVCAGMIVKVLTDDKSIFCDLNDAAIAVMALYKSLGKNLLKMAKASDHGKYLVEIGFEDDLKSCTGVDTIPILPLLIGNVIKLKKEEVKQPITLDVKESTS
jgi:2-phosphosulfolactate phosphatase